MKFFIAFLAILLITQSIAQSDQITSFDVKDKVVGIYTQPAHFVDDFPGSKYAYILNSNIKWIQENGGQVLALSFNSTQAYYDDIFKNIDGILFTGGGLDLDIDTPLNQYDQTNVFTANAKYLIEKAKTANKANEFFPIWGNCQGFELLTYVESDYQKDILQHIDNDENVTRVGKFEKQSRLFQNMSQDMIDQVETNAFCFYYHELAVYEDVFKANQNLVKNYNIIGHGTNGTSFESPDQITFVSAIEHTTYPFYALQFHPEYTMYNDNMNTNNTRDSLAFNSYFGDFYLNHVVSQSTNTPNLNDPIFKKATFDNMVLDYQPEQFFQYIYYIENFNLE